MKLLLWILKKTTQKCVHTMSATDTDVNLFLCCKVSKLKGAWGAGEYFTSKSKFLGKKSFVSLFLIVLSVALWCSYFCCFQNTFKKEKENSRLLGFSYHWESFFVRQDLPDHIHCLSCHHLAAKCLVRFSSFEMSVVCFSLFWS